MVELLEGDRGFPKHGPAVSSFHPPQDQFNVVTVADLGDAGILLSKLEDDAG